jgi:hypothetical protein
MAQHEKTTQAEFMAATVRVLQALVHAGGGPLFLHVGRSAVIDSDKILAIPAFPRALVHHLEGQLQGANGEVWDNVFGVTIFQVSTFDGLTDAACEWLDKTSRIVIRELQDSRHGDNVICRYQGPDETLLNDAGVDVVQRQLSFTYSIDEDTN